MDSVVAELRMPPLFKGGKPELVDWSAVQNG